MPISLMILITADALLFGVCIGYALCLHQWFKGIEYETMWGEG